VAGGQDHVPLGGIDDPRVLDIRGDEIDLAAQGGGDGPLVLDETRLDPRGKVVSTREEILVAQVQGGGDEAIDVDPRPWSEEDAVGIDEEDPAVGLEGAEDRRGVLADDAVQNGAEAVLLDEAGQFVRADGESLPVDDAVGTVGHRQGVALVLEGDIPVNHLRPVRIGEGEIGAEEEQGNEAEKLAAAGTDSVYFSLVTIRTAIFFFLHDPILIAVVS